MKVLVACEYSGTVRDAFTRAGHNAWSCDILPTESSGQHYTGDVRDMLHWDWDLLIAHPPCTYLTNSGVSWLHKREDRWSQLQAGVKFFQLFQNQPHIHRIAIENPIPHKYARIHIGKYDQTIQPYQYGHPESKRTCLWLKNLPLLTPTHILDKPERGYWDNQTPSGQNKLAPSPDRWKIRSTFYTGWAEAMAQQWGELNAKD